MSLFYLYFSVKVPKGPRNSVVQKGGEIGESERFCYIDVIMRGRGSMILDGIRYGEKESTKIYFSKDV